MAEKKCTGCGVKDLSILTMSSADWERNEQRHERREKRFVWLIALLILLLVGTNVCWLVCENQFETVEETSETTITQDNENGFNNYIGNDGDIINGKTDDKD